MRPKSSSAKKPAEQVVKRQPRRGLLHPIREPRRARNIPLSYTNHTGYLVNRTEEEWR